MAILSNFNANSLVAFAPVNHQFYSLVVRIIHARLLHEAPLPDNQLLLEAFHPSQKYYIPYLSCKYQKLVARDGPEIEDSPKLADLHRLYASFHPFLTREDPVPRRIARARFHIPRLSNNIDDERAAHEVNLDENERFSQLCAVLNVVKEGPRQGLFISHVNVMDKVIRIFRSWLTDLAGKNACDIADEERILWLDTSRNAGLRFRVMLAPSERMPLISEEDEPSISFMLEYEGKSFQLPTEAKIGT